jgi:hypothetical protein
MIILKEQVAAQSFKFIPRTLSADSMIIEDEAQNTSDTIAITPTIDRYYLVVTEALTLVEGRFYTLTVLDGSDIIYKDKIFCTNQVVEDYSISDGEYIEHSSDDTFIIID